MRREFEGFERLGREIPVERAVSGCFEKKPFDSKNQARDFARRGNKLFGHSASDPYKCHVCGKYHLTSLSKVKQAKARKRDWGKSK